MINNSKNATGSSLNSTVKKIAQLIEGYPAWFKQRRKVEQFFLLYGMIGIIPFILFAVFRLLKAVFNYLYKIKYKGFALQTSPFIFLMIIGYVGAFISSFLVGRIGLMLYLFPAIIIIPVLYFKKGNGSTPKSWLLSFLLLIGGTLLGQLGIHTSLLGGNVRASSAQLLEKNVEPANGALYKSQIDNFITNNMNWLSIWQQDSLNASAKFHNTRYTTYENELAIERQRQAIIKQKEKEAAAEALRQRSIADGSYMPSESDIRPACKKLSEARSLTGYINWGWFNHSWYPSQKTLIMRGKSKNAFGVEIPFAAECRWEKGGNIRLVEITR